MARCPPLIPLGPARPSAAPQPPPPPTPPLSSSSTLHRLRSLFRARDFSCAAAAINAPAYFAFSSTWSWPAISFCPSAVWWGVGGGEGEEGFYFRWQLLHARRLGAVPIPTVIGHFFSPPLLRLSRSLVPSLHACMHALSPPRSFSPVAIGSQCQFIFPVRRRIYMYT